MPVQTLFGSRNQIRQEIQEPGSPGLEHPTGKDILRPSEGVRLLLLIGLQKNLQIPDQIQPLRPCLQLHANAACIGLDRTLYFKM